jgi:hypothetical protein
MNPKHLESISVDETAQSSGPGGPGVKSRAADQFHESKALERLLSRGIAGANVPERPPHSNPCSSAFDRSRAVGPWQSSELAARLRASRSST